MHQLLAVSDVCIDIKNQIKHFYAPLSLKVFLKLRWLPCELYLSQHILYKFSMWHVNICDLCYHQYQYNGIQSSHTSQIFRDLPRFESASQKVSWMQKKSPENKNWERNKKKKNWNRPNCIKIICNIDHQLPIYNILT